MTVLDQERGAVCAPIRGGVATLRPLRLGETGPLLTVFDGLSAASRTSRFLHPVSSLSPSMLRALSTVDGVDRVVWVAEVDGRPAGIGRYAVVAPGVVEIAFEVVDAHQGKGLGAALLDVLTTLARGAGFDRLEAYLLGSNVASAHLLRQVGLSLAAASGVLEGEGEFRLLHPPRVDRAAVLELGRLSRAGRLTA